MTQIQQKELTENELVLELQKAGFEEFSKRDIGDWRRHGLLPDFDIKSRGLGKGLGKSEGVWKQSGSVIEQAEWICRMRSAGIGYGDFHLNLWMLGYDIYPKDVRDSLLEPLVERIEMLESEARKFQRGCDRTDNIIEDVISEGATEAISNMLRNPFESFIMPQELLEAVANIFLNPEYDLDDFGFADSFEALEKWESETQKFELETFGIEGLKLENPNKKIQTIYNFLDNADFIQQCFSLHQVEKAVRECTHKDLAQAQNDMRIIAKIFMIFARNIQTVLLHIPLLSDNSTTTNQFLPLLFSLSELLVLADISLRHNGYSEKIAGAREQMLNKIEIAFSETVQKEIEQSAPFLGQAVTQAFEVFERKLTQLTANPLEFQAAN